MTDKMWEKSIWMMIIIQQIFIEMNELVCRRGKKQILLYMQQILNVNLNFYQEAP